MFQMGLLPKLSGWPSVTVKSEAVSSSEMLVLYTKASALIPLQELKLLYMTRHFMSYSAGELKGKQGTGATCVPFSK